MEMITAYLRRFAALVTGWYDKYNSDLFVRTTTNIVLLQTGLVMVTITAFWFVLQYSNREILSYVVERIADIITNNSSESATQVQASVSEIQLKAVWYIFGGVVGIAVLSGIILARFTLGPTRDVLRRQKLFISNVAHELRTPLSSIKTSTEVELMDENLDAGVRKTFISIVEELNRISDIINNLLSLDTFSRPERMQFSNVDLGSVVKEVIRRHAAFADERGVKIITKMDAHRVVWGNAAALEQVVSNLLKNALNYTPRDNGGTVTISIQPDYYGSTVLTVSDTGIGISQKDLFHIFEPFYRADASRARSTKRSGSGLGLSIVNEIVRMHHGRINIRSALRKGTMVSVYLPSGLPHNMIEIEEGTLTKDKERLSEVSVDFSKGFNGKG